MSNVPLDKYPDMFVSETSIDGAGVIRWTVDGRVPPSDLLFLWHKKGVPFELTLSIATRKAEEMRIMQQWRDSDRV